MRVYQGPEKYIFVSYAHQDSPIVHPLIEKLQARGFRIWFDRGIEGGTEWPEYIAKHLVESACVLAFMSNAAAASRNCRNEINMALSRGIDMLVAHIEKTKMTLGLELQLNASQAILCYKHKSEEDMLDELAESAVLAGCRCEVTQEASPEETVREVPTQEESEETAAEAEPTPAPVSEEPSVPGAPPPPPPSDGLTFRKTTALTEYMVLGLGDCKDTHVVIPEVHNGIAVGTIAKSAFSKTQTITAVTIPLSVTKVEGMAFENCKRLTDIYCVAPSKPSGWSIMWKNGCDATVHWGMWGPESPVASSTGVKIPAAPAEKKPGFGVSAAEKKKDSSDALEFRMAEDEKSYIVVKLEKKGEHHLVIPETYRGLPVSAIEKDAFAEYAALESIFIPEGVSHVGGNAFRGCNSLKDIYCGSQTKPSGWNFMWRGDCGATIHWGSKPE